MKLVASNSGDRKGRGSAAFAVLLQQVESLVFVDEILAKCYEQGLKVLSKHDSIVCRQCDKNKVTKVICRVLNKLFGKWTYALDIDGELFDLQPKRKSRLGRVADGVVKTLFGVVGLGNGPLFVVCPGDESPGVDGISGDSGSIYAV